MNDKKQTGNGVNPLVVGAVGAAVGAVAVALSDKKNRDKVMETLNQAGDKAEKLRSEAEDKMDDVKSQVDDMSGKAEKAADELKKKIK